MSDPIADFLEKLRRAMREEKWLLAAYYAAEVLQVESGNVSAWTALGRVAVVLGRREAAERFWSMSAANDPGHINSATDAANLLSRINELREGLKPHEGPRYLVIRDWGAGFWSDVDHVISQLLVADATGRTPVVYWGETSKFYPRKFSGNAWEEYFEPVSSVCMAQVVSEAAGLTIAPSKWNFGNLTGPVFNRWNGDGSRFSSILALGSWENIVVADFHTSSSIIGLWIPPTVPMLRLPFNLLLKRFVRPRKEILDRVAVIRSSWGAGPVVAMHLRETDKPIEQPSIVQANEAIEGDALRRADNLGARVFLMTDSVSTRARLSERIGERLITTDAIRSDGSEGLHMTGEHDPRQLAIEVMVDTYLAASCDEFFGCGASNVACMVARLRTDHTKGLTMYGMPNHAKANSFSMTFKRPE